MGVFTGFWECPLSFSVRKTYIILANVSIFLFGIVFRTVFCRLRPALVRGI